MPKLRSLTRRQASKWENNISVREFGCGNMNWIHLAKCRNFGSPLHNNNNNNNNNNRAR